MERSGYMFGMAAVVIWTGFILVSRQGGLGPLNPNDVIAIRYLTCSLVVLPIWLIWQRFNLLQGRIVVSALLGGLAYALCAFQGFQLAPASHAAVLMPGTLPMLTIVFAALVNHERFAANKWIGVLVMSVGIGCLLLAQWWGSEGFNAGHGWFVAAAACWALFTVLVKRWQITPWQVTISLAVVTAAVYLPVYILWLPKNITQASWNDIALQAFYQGFLATVIQMICYMQAVRRLGPATMGSLMALVPVLAGFSALYVFDEPLTYGLTIALVLVSLGSWSAHSRFFESRRVAPCPIST